MLRSEVTTKQIPLKIVGSTVFGRYSKISVEETYNMIISDGFLVDYSGYKAVLNLVPGGVGRGAYTSTASNRMIAVVSNSVFVIIPGLSAQLVGNLNTSSGDIFIAENNNKEIAITDYSNIYIYQYSSAPSFKVGATAGGDFTLPPTLKHPGYISFQNGRFLVANTGTEEWQLSEFNQGTVWPGTAPFVGQLQTKPDTVQAPVPFPGRGNLLFLFGFTVAESWTDQGLALFPYARNSTFNVDYGCLNAATIAANEDIIVWLAGNEQSGPAIMYSNGGTLKRISTDGIDFKLSNLTNPTDCYGFLFRQDGHVIYQFVFPTDNLSYIYDFNTEKFFTVTDENLNHHIAKEVIFFNNKYYFVSSIDGNFYEFDTSLTNYQYTLDGNDNPIVAEIPRIRIPPPLRVDSQRSFIIKKLGFTIEQGQPNVITTIPVTIPNSAPLITTEDNVIITTESGIALRVEQEEIINYQLASSRVDLSISRDGGVTFGSSLALNMNPTGVRKSLFTYRRLGRANDASFQLRFVGFDRFTVTDGIVEIYQ